MLRHSHVLRLLASAPSAASVPSTVEEIGVATRSTVKSQPKLLKLSCVNGSLLEAPIWEEKRGNNWLAVIDVDGTKPGGLARRFLPHGRGECFYMVEQLAVFDPIEFGADRTAWSGNRVRGRWYGVLVERGDGFLLLEPTETGAQAVVVSKERRLGVPRPVPPPPPPPPTPEQLQAWAEAVQAARLLLDPPKRGSGKEAMDRYLERMAAQDYRGAYSALQSAAWAKNQKKPFYDALETARVLLHPARVT